MGLFNRKPKAQPQEQEERGIYLGSLGYNGMTTYTNSQAMRLSACYCAVNSISNSCAVLPINVVKDNGKDRKQMYDHPLRKLLNSKPDLRHTHFMLFKQLIESVLLRGNGYALVIRDEKLNVQQLVYLDTDFVQPIPQENGTIKYLVTGYNRLFDSDDILDFHLHLDESFRGISVIKYASRALETAYEADKTATNFFKSGGNLAGILKPQAPIQTNQRQQIADAWRESFDQTSDRVPIVVMPYGVDFQSVSISPEDAELLDTRQYGIAEIARFFNIPVQKLYGEVNGAGKNMDIEDIQMLYLLDTILPFTQMMKEEIETKLFRPSERGKYSIEFDYSALYKANKKTEAEYYRALINIGVLSINEVRAKLNYDAIDSTAGDAHWVQLSYATAEDVAEGKYINNKGSQSTQEDNKLVNNGTDKEKEK